MWKLTCLRTDHSEKYISIVSSVLLRHDQKRQKWTLTFPTLMAKRTILGHILPKPHKRVKKLIFPNLYNKKPLLKILAVTSQNVTLILKSKFTALYYFYLLICYLSFVVVTKTHILPYWCNYRGRNLLGQNDFYIILEVIVVV